MFQRAIELGDGYIGAGSTSIGNFLDDIKNLPSQFPKAKRLYVALGDELPRLREWFKVFYGNGIWQSRWPYGDLQTESRSR